jgi:lysophospholipase L1-like esterase
MPRGKFQRLKWLALLFVVLCAVAVHAFWRARNRYENQLAQQIWPVMAPDISARSSSPAGSEPTVLLLGDSRMAQWDLPQLSRWRVVNAGAGGLTTGQLRLGAPKLLDEFRPDAVVLEAGINDLKYIGLRPEMASRIISLAASNLAAVVHECAARHCRVILLETWPASQPDLARRLVWNAAIPAGVASLNAQLRLLNAPGQGIRVVDLFKDAGLQPEARLYRDTLHFKPEVYQRLTPAVEKELAPASRNFP